MSNDITIKLTISDELLAKALSLLAPRPMGIPMGLLQGMQQPKPKPQPKNPVGFKTDKKCP
tara:strand:- start:520 stop:702 length:183 start_codon:yes stop_codon:yes gene_type:complete